MNEECCVVNGKRFSIHCEDGKATYLERAEAGIALSLMHIHFQLDGSRDHEGQLERVRGQLDGLIETFKAIGNL